MKTSIANETSKALLLISNVVSLLNAKRQYNVIKKGYDIEQESLYDTLGFSKDSQAQQVRRGRQELQQGFVLEVMKSAKHKTSPESKRRLQHSVLSHKGMQETKKLEEENEHKLQESKIDKVKRAYSLLHNNRFRANYCAHSNPSNDTQLHILCDGDQVAANYNPEHQNFIFVDHSIPVNVLSSSSSSSSYKGDKNVQYSLNDFNEAYYHATGVKRESTFNAKMHNPSERHTALHGSDIPFTLPLTFDESVHGCSKVVRYKKWTRCECCNGEGRCNNVKIRRACPQCCGRGSVILPSATYHIEKKCTYCLGEGHTPPPKCSTCNGNGVNPMWVSLPVQLPAGLQSMSRFVISNAGNDGCRGGKTGNLVMTLVISEHRHFHRLGNDLHAMLPLPLSTALLGGLVTVSTLHGPVQLHIPPCICNGHLLRITGAGVRNECNDSTSEHISGNQTNNKQNKGDMIYHALIIIPFGDKLTGRQKAALGNYEQCRSNGDSSSSNNDNKGFDKQEEEEEEEENLFEQCARLKEQYKHWFTNTL